MGLYRALSNCNRRIYYLLTAILAGVLIFKFLPIASSYDIDDMKIYYVSQNEIMELEQSRIRKIEENNQRQLFLGRGEEAADLIEAVAMKYDGKNSRIIFSENKIYGKGVKSISRVVYEEVISELKEQAIK